MGGREGIIDTAVKTQETGYISRRMVKKMENNVYSYVGTVVNSSGQIISFDYNDGFDSSLTMNGMFCDPRKLIEQLNQEYEVDHGLLETFKRKELREKNDYLLDEIMDFDSIYDGLDIVINRVAVDKVIKKPIKKKK